MTTAEVPMEHFDVGAGPIAYRSEGSGPPVVFVHGSVLADPWGPTIGHAELDRTHRVITFHRRGYGQSASTPPGPSLADDGADIVALLDHLRIGQAQVVGHSLAANIVLQAVLDAPERFSSMALLEPGLFSVPSAAGFSEMIQPIVDLYAAGEHRRAMLLFLGGPRGGELMARLEGVLGDGTADRAQADVSVLFGHDLTAGPAWVLDQDRARSLGHRTLLAVGSNTGPIYRETHEVLVELLANVDPLTIADSGHFVHVEQPEAVGGALAAFLRSV